MAPYPIFFRALKTIIMPNFMLLTESEQFKHISALLYRVTSKGRGRGEGVPPKKVLRNGNLVGKIFIFKDFGWDLIPLLFDFFFGEADWIGRETE